MFNQEFFQSCLPEHIRAKAEEAVDQPSLHLRLHGGQEYTIVSILEAGPGWVVCEVYPPKGKTPREHHPEDRKGGAPRYDFDRVAVPYGSIALIVVTLEPKSKGLGFRT